MKEILEVTLRVGECRTVAELQEYISSLPKELRDNAKLQALFSKRLRYLRKLEANTINYGE